MELLYQEHDFRKGSLAGAAPGTLQQVGVQPRQSGVDFLQGRQLVAAERGQAAGLAQVGRQLFDEFSKGPTPLAAGQGGLVVDAAAACRKDSSCF